MKVDYRVVFSKDFNKAYKRVPVNIQHKFKERLKLFLQDPFHKLLNNHDLHGEYMGDRSINITGDYRAIFELPEPGIVNFLDIGTHHKLYE